MFSESETYINFREDTVKRVLSQEAFVAKVNEFESNGFIRIDFTTIGRNIIHSLIKNPKVPGIYMIRSKNCANVKRINSYTDLYIFERNGKKQWFSTNSRDDNKNTQTSGTRCTRYVQERFKQRTGKSFIEAFGSTEEEIKYCIPKSFYYVNDRYLNKDLDHISAIDFCSQYPSMLCGNLPTANDCIRVKGQADPTEEYPFAFYVKSGHCAEYNRFDTRKWIYSYYGQNLLALKENRWNADFRLNPKEDETILMKNSDYKLEDEMNFYYNKRDADPFAKQVMVSMIGCFHMDYYRAYRLGHLAAIAIARANDRMMKLAEQMDLEGNQVIHICVDGCIYKGSKEYGVSEKKLLNCYQEFTDCKFRMRAMNCYIAMKDNNIIKFKHGAFDSRFDGQNIDDVCNGLNDVDQWYKRETELEKLEKEVVA